eukprot:scaffold2604_cov198-Alexandrium_tamarense.AAC.14
MEKEFVVCRDGAFESLARQRMRWWRPSAVYRINWRLCSLAQETSGFFCVVCEWYINSSCTSLCCHLPCRGGPSFNVEQNVRKTKIILHVEIM